jgi:hypothetical protein
MKIKEEKTTIIFILIILIIGLIPDLSSTLRVRDFIVFILIELFAQRLLKIIDEK